jgi:hypothetical protein
VQPFVRLDAGIAGGIMPQWATGPELFPAAAQPAAPEPVAARLMVDPEGSDVAATAERALAAEAARARAIQQVQQQESLTLEQQQRLQAQQGNLLGQQRLGVRDVQQQEQQR